MRKRLPSAAIVVCSLAFAVGHRLAAQTAEPPYFVTYSSVMEEPDNLEISYRGTEGTPPNANGFYSSTVEFEYGTRAWWTTEVYLSGVTVDNDSTVFTGFRFENRFHVLPREHFLNPLLYVEYEDVNDDDRGVLEVTGHDGNSSLNLTNAQGRKVIERELELKLILDSNFKGWNVAENFISEKNFNEPEPWEFGYAVGASRPLGLAASGHKCVFCAENFSAGLELYGGLSTLDDFGLHATSQYLGPTVQWNIPHGPALQFSPNVGLNDNSVPVLYRFSVTYEIQQFANRLFHRKP